METKIKNIPVVPVEKISRLKDGYVQRFDVAAEQMADVIKKYSVRYRHEPITSIEQLPQPETNPMELGLIVEGVSKLVAHYGCVAYDNGKVYIESVGQWLLFNNTLYRFYNQRRGPYVFLKIGAAESPRYFKFNEPAPQKVGKATMKKLQAWAEWLDRKEEAIKACRKEADDKVNAFLTRLNDSGLKFKRNGTRISIYNGCLVMNVDIDENDIYPSTPEFDNSAFYTDYLRNGKTRLDFMLDNIITVTPKN